MSIDDGKLLYDEATGKLMYDRATGKLLYGLDVDVFTYAQMNITFVPNFIPPWVPQIVTFKLQEVVGVSSTSWRQVAVDDPDPTYDMDWFLCSVAANTNNPFPPGPGPNPVVDGYRWNAELQYTTNTYQGSEVFLIPTAGAPPPHDYPDGVYPITLTMDGSPFPLVMTVTLTISSTPIPPFT